MTLSFPTRRSSDLAWCVCNAADKRVIPRERYLRRSPGGAFPRQRMVPPECYASVRPPTYSPDRWLCGISRRAHRPCRGSPAEHPCQGTRDTRGSNEFSVLTDRKRVVSDMSGSVGFDLGGSFHIET